MQNTILFLIPLTTLSLSLAALLYAAVFRLVGRRIVAAPVPVAVPVADVPGQLSYATADLRPPLFCRLLCRWPILAALPILLLTAAPMGTLLGVFIVGTFPVREHWTPLFLPFTIVNTVAAMIFTVAFLWMTRRGLRRTGPASPPHAAGWPIRRCAARSLACFTALLLALAVAELRARHTLAQAEGEMRQWKASLRDPAMRSAGQLLAKAAAQYDAIGAPGLTDRMGRPLATLPTGVDTVVALLHEATAGKDDSYAPLPANHTSSMAKLLVAHGKAELQQGRWEAANRDLAAIQTMARQFGHSDDFIGMLIAVILDGLGDTLFPDVADAATTEVQLDAISLQPRSWYEHHARQFREVWALYVHEEVVGTAQGRLTRDWFTILLQRWIFLDGDLTAAHAMRTRFAQTPLPHWRTPLTGEAGLNVPLTMFNKAHFLGPNPDGLRIWVHRELNDAGIAVLRFRIRTGRLPATLDEVVAAGILPAVPANPWDGKPITYTRTATGATLSAPAGAATPTFTITANPAGTPASQPTR